MNAANLSLVAARGAALGAALTLAGCIKSPVAPVNASGPSAGSETHWLMACTRAADCPETADCLCGLCTVSCADDAACDAAVGGSTCVPAEEPALVVSCGGVPPERPVCLAPCQGDADCGSGTICNDARCVAGARPAAPGAPRTQIFNYPARPKLDVLFVVDDSGSMCEEQATLATGLRSVVDRIAPLDARIAVVSTDLRTADARGRFRVAPASSSEILNCPAEGPVLDCEAALARVAISDGILAVEPDVTADVLAEALGCLVTLGTTGDGFEKGLEAMRLALACDGPQAALYGACCVDGKFDPLCDASLAFLRPDAALLVVVISDEPDCSDPASHPKASTRAMCKYGPADGVDANTLPDGFQDPELCPAGEESCYADECGELEPDDCYEQRCVISRADNNNCVWHREALTPISEYVEFLRGLKRWPEFEVRVVPIVGPAPTLDSGEEIIWVEGTPVPVCDPMSPDYDPETPMDVCCPNGVCTGGITPTCQSDSGKAFTGARYRQLGDAFCGQGCERLDEVTICDADFRVDTALDAIATPLGAVLCLEVSAGAGQTLAVWDGDAVLPQTDWRIEDNADCPGGLHLRLLVPTPGATYEIRVVEAG